MLIQSLYKLAPIQGKKTKVKVWRKCGFEGCTTEVPRRKTYCVEHQVEMLYRHLKKAKRNT